MGKDSRYWAGRYAGSSSFKFQGVNKPKPPTKVDPERHYTGNCCGDPGCAICANWKKLEPGAYYPKQYASGFGTGSFSSQYQNKPKPPVTGPLSVPPLPKPRKASKATDPGICAFAHCEVCKKPVEGEPHGGFCGDVGCSICASYRRPITAKYYSGMVVDDLANDEPAPIQFKKWKKWMNRIHDNQKSKKEVNMSEEEYTDDYEEMTLYEVNTVYGEDRNKVVVEQEHVVAESEKRALLQCKTIPEDWDMDYVTREATSVCSVRVKRKPREILKG